MPRSSSRSPSRDRREGEARERRREAGQDSHKGSSDSRGRGRSASSEQEDRHRRRDRDDDRDDRRKSARRERDDSSRRYDERRGRHDRDRRRRRSSSRSRSSRSGGDSSASSYSSRSSSSSRSRDRHRRSRRHRSRSGERDRRRHRSDRRRSDRRRSRSRERSRREHSRSRDSKPLSSSGGGGSGGAAAAPAGAAFLPAPAAPPAAAAAPAASAATSRVFGYSNEDNPFGDTALSETFVWKKKIVKEIVNGTRERVPTKAEQAAERDALVEEIERARKRREEREKEMEERERLKAEEARLRDAAHYQDWEAAQADFHLLQARQRAFLRIRDGRESAVEALAKNVLIADAVEAAASPDPAKRHGLDLEVLSSVSKLLDVADPVDALSALSISDLEAAARDVAAFKEVHEAASSGRRRVGYWEALAAVVSDTLGRKKAFAAAAAASSSSAAAEGSDAPRAPRMSSAQMALLAVQTELSALLDAKTLPQLVAMEGEVKALIRAAVEARRPGAAASAAGLAAAAAKLGLGDAIDVEHWESVLGAMGAAKARAVLREAHVATVATRVAQLEAEAAPILAALADVAAQKAEAAAAAKAEKAGAAAGQEAGADEADAGGAPGVAVATEAPAPPLLPTPAEEGLPQLLAERIAKLRAAGVLPRPSAGSAAAGGAAAAAGGDGEWEGDVDAAGRALPSGAGEAALGADAEVAVVPAPRRRGGRGAAASGPTSAPLSSEAAAAYEAALASHGASLTPAEASALLERYKPRKPRFFNRVRTGYDWNKYNKAHYDIDNPPPKTVQGYRFNLFYPDLLDRSLTPRYYLEPADSDDYCIIRFHAGPPYEDVAFKIVNKEWEFDKRRGFRCVFDKGTLSLWFNFKRHFYRK